jgi:hypothetical protein
MEKSRIQKISGNPGPAQAERFQKTTKSINKGIEKSKGWKLEKPKG